MLSKRTYDKIRKGLEVKVWNVFRLVKKEGDEDKVIMNWGDVRGKVEDKIKRLNYMREKIDRDLPEGNYEIQCRASNARLAVIESFPVEIKGKSTETLPVKDNTEDKTNEQETMYQFDLDEYKKLVNENAQLKAINRVLEDERDMYKNIVMGKSSLKVAGLNDGPTPVEKSTAEVVMQGLSETLSPLAELAAKYMETQQQRIALEEKKIQLGMVKKSPTKKLNPNNMTVRKIATESLEDRIARLLEEDPIQADIELDELEANDPDEYDRICEVLGLFGEDEEEEFEEEEEEEGNA
jgi:hypothetical protein